MFHWNPKDIENITLQKLKLAYINKAKTELKETHPEKTPGLLLSYFSQDLIQNPVISDKGRVYDAAEIEKWLESHTTDELREPLSLSALHPFPELKLLIEDYKISLREYALKKKSLLNLARKNAALSTQEPPELFICPISKQLIQCPVISNLGVVYDRTSFTSKSKEDLNSSETVVAFTEFEQYLNFYRWQVEQSQQALMEIDSLSNNNQSSLVEFSQYVYSSACSFFSLITGKERQNQSAQNQSSLELTIL